MSYRTYEYRAQCLLETHYGHHIRLTRRITDQLWTYWIAGLSVADAVQGMR